MIRFDFRVGKAFLNENYPYRYITVPKSKVDYGILAAERLDCGELTVTCPDGRKVTGYMHKGMAGYGPYYQIRIRKDRGDPLSDLHLGQSLGVEIERMGEDFLVVRLAEG